MPKTFMMKLNRIQPTQLFISSEKLSEVMKTFDAANPASIKPIPIKRLKNKIILDGHTRAFAAFLHGFSKFQCIGKMKNSTGRLTKSALNGARKRVFTR